VSTAAGLPVCFTRSTRGARQDTTLAQSVSSPSLCGKSPRQGDLTGAELMMGLGRVELPKSRLLAKHESSVLSALLWGFMHWLKLPDQVIRIHLQEPVGAVSHLLARAGAVISREQGVKTLQIGLGTRFLS
jgi:hypothetical protein